MDSMTPISDALANSRNIHEAVGAQGIGELAAQWSDHVAVGAVPMLVAARLIALGAVYPSEGVLWAAENVTALAMNSTLHVNLDVDDSSSGLATNSGTVAQVLGSSPNVGVEHAQLLVRLVERPSSSTA